MARVHVNTELSKYKKEETTPEEYRQRFNQIIATHYSDFKLVYTHGSRMNTLTGAAVIYEDRTEKIHLPKHASTYTAEAYSIMKALSIMETQNRVRLAMCSDSLSVLRSLQNIYNTDPLIVEIKRAIHSISTNNGQITYIWILSHVGIEGNGRR